MKIFCLIFLLSNLSWASDFLPSSFSAQYEESFKSAATGRVKKSTGKIDYKYPRRIRFEVLAPNPSTFVANPKTSWYYTPPFIEGEEGQVVIQQSEDLVLTKFLDSLKGGAISNSAYNVAFNKELLTIIFKPALQQDIQIDKAVLTAIGGDAQKAGSLTQFSQLELFHSNGKHVTMKFQDMKADVPFAESHFDFKMPLNTKVTQGK